MLNPHILLVLQCLDNPESVSVAQLEKNSLNARANYDSTLGPCNGVPAFLALKASCLAYGTSYRAADSCCTDYFSYTGENKQDYLVELERTK